MEKRFFLALALSFLVLMSYSSFSQKHKPIENKEVVTNTVQKPLVSIPAVTSQATATNVEQCIVKALEEKDLYKINTNGLILNFSKKGGYIYDAFDVARKTTLPFRNIGFVPEWSEYEYNVTALPNGVIFDCRDEAGHKITKKFQVNSGNSIDLIIDISNVTNSKITSYNVIAGLVVPTEEKDPMSQRYFEASALVNNIMMRKAVHGLKSILSYDGRIEWVGIRDRYFCSILLPQAIASKSVIEKTGSAYSVAINIAGRTLDKGALGVEDIYSIYIGPQDEKLLKKFNVITEQIVNFGTFDLIAKALMSLLVAGHNVTRNWGWSIIFVTILVYLILFPLSLKSMLSMKKMQALQPKIEELRKKLKNDSQKLNLEIMELYKKEKVNPFGGCLPMLLQIPVFFALYQVLMRLISLKGAQFLWIKDLSQPDRLFVFNAFLPVVGNELNLLPLLMAGGMFIQQKFTTPAMGGDSSAAEQQKIMSIVMPILFGVLFYKMPSGLVLYWFVNNILMILFQWKISGKKASV